MCSFFRSNFFVCVSFFFSLSFLLSFSLSLTFDLRARKYRSSGEWIQMSTAAADWRRAFITKSLWHLTLAFDFRRSLSLFVVGLTHSQTRIFRSNSAPASASYPNLIDANQSQGEFWQQKWKLCRSTCASRWRNVRQKSLFFLFFCFFSLPLSLSTDFGRVYSWVTKTREKTSGLLNYQRKSGCFSLCLLWIISARWLLVRLLVVVAVERML